MFNRNELLEALINIKDEINQQIPLATNRFEQFECVPSYTELGEDETLIHEENIHRQFLAHEQYVNTQRNKFSIYEHLNAEFQNYLVQQNIGKPQEINALQKKTFKARAIKESSIMINKTKRTQQLLGGSVNSLEIENYLTENIDSLIEALCQGQQLIIEDADLAHRFKKDLILAEHRDISQKQLFINKPALLASLQKDASTENQQKFDKAYAISLGIYFDRIKTDVGYCGEHAVLSLIKIYEAYLIKGETVLEEIFITYFDENDQPNDGHTFLAINRDPDSKLSDIASWGSEAILFDAWNKLVCKAEDYPSLAHHYFSFPEGAKWESLKFNNDDFWLIRSLNTTYERFYITGNSEREKREPLLLEEYGLVSLENPDLQTCKNFLNNLLQKLLPNNFNYQVEIYITTLGKQPVKVPGGFNEPKIAVHKDFLLEIAAGSAPIATLEFAILRALYFIKHFPLANEGDILDTDNLYLDKLAIEQSKNGPVAIDFLRRCIEFEKKHTETHPFKIIISDTNFNLNAIGLAYQQRIKNINTLLAQHEQFRTGAAATSAPKHIASELENIHKENLFFPGFYKCKNRLEKIKYLQSQLAVLHIELLPYESSNIPSIRLKEFCRLLTDININLQDPEHAQAIDELLDAAFDLKISGFEYIYHCILGFPKKTWDKAYLIPLGPFKALQQHMAEFIFADKFLTASNAAIKFMACEHKLKNHFGLSLHESERLYTFKYKKDHGNQPPTGQDRFFGSSIGHNIIWQSFILQNYQLSWERHLAWSHQDKTQTIAKTLWRLGAVKDKRLWPVFSLKQLFEFTSLEHKNFYPPLSTRGARFDDNEYEAIHYMLREDASLNHRPQAGMFNDPLISFETAFIQFYDLNIAGLIAPHDNFNTNNQSIRFLLRQFARIAIRGSQEDRKVVKSFFLGRQDGRDMKHLQEGSHRQLDYDTPYIKFIFEQRYENIEFELFSLEDFINILNDLEICFKAYEVPAIQILRMFKLDFDTFSLTCIKQLIPLLKAKSLQTHMNKIFEEHIKQYGPFQLFSLEAVEICHLINQYMPELFFSKERRTLLASFIWPSSFFSSPQNMEINDLIYLYRTFDVNLSFPSLSAQQYLGGIILENFNRLQDAEAKISAAEKILFVESKGFKIPLADLQLRNSIASLWVELILLKHGKDSNLDSYVETITPIINQVFQASANRDVIYILNLLANALETQQRLSDYLGTLLEPEKYLVLKKAKSSTSNAVNVLGAISSYLGKNSADKLQFLDFLSAPLSTLTLNAFSNHLLQHRKADQIAKILGYSMQVTQDIKTVEHLSQLLYHMFWDRHLEERAVVINYLLLPPDTEVDEQTQRQAYAEAYIYVAKKLFPRGHDEASDDHAALAFFKAYLDTADNYSRGFLLAAMLVTSNEAQQTARASSVGKKLALLCEHMGPAYVKLAQAIHSHPQTPENIRSDLDHIKGRANPPTRWQLWRILCDTVPAALRTNIARVGGLLGSASYNMALQIRLSDNNEVVLLLLREHAEKDAKKGFAHLKSTFSVCQHKKINSLRSSALEMIDEASELSLVELSHECGDIQNKLAVDIYHLSMFINSARDTYNFNIYPSKTISSGAGYRFIEKISGTEFNDLSAATAHDIEIRKLVARTVMTMEFINILSGRHFDCDRHGNQLRVMVDEENRVVNLGLYDFGEMLLNEPGQEELQQFKKLIHDLPMAFLRNIAVDKIFSGHIEQALQSGQETRYLMRIRKAFLALEDFRKTLSAHELLDIMKVAAKSSKVSPVLREAFADAVQRLDLLNSVYRQAAGVVGFFKMLLPGSTVNPELSKKCRLG